jgi:hypothetical protein
MVYAALSRDSARSNFVNPNDQPASKLNSAGEAILRFDKATVRRLVEHARNSPKSRSAYGEQDAGPALWLVGDAGIYLMSNGLPPISYTGEILKGNGGGKTPYLTAPAVGCDPRYDSAEKWWPLHEVFSEGSDFVLAIPIGEIETALSGSRFQIVLVGNEDGYALYSDVEYDSAAP